MIRVDAQKKELEISGVAEEIGAEISAILIGAYEAISEKNGVIDADGVIASSIMTWIEYIKGKDCESSDQIMGFLNDCYEEEFNDAVVLPRKSNSNRRSGWRKLS